MKILDRTVFDTKVLWATLAILLLMTPLQMWSRGSAYACFVPLALVAILMRRVEQMMLWLLSSMLLIVGNPFFLPKNATFFIAQRLLFIFLGFCMLAQVFGRRQSSTVSPLLGMLFYLGYMALTSIFGWNPTISYLKLFLFTIVYFAYYGVANMAAQDHRFDERKVRGIVLAIAAYFVFGSLLLIPFPAISQLTGEEYEMAIKSGQDVTSLFKGMTLHSQTLGPLMASVFAFLFADLVINVRKMNGLYLSLLLACPFLIYKTSSRTGMATLLMCVAMVGCCALRMRGIGAHWREKVKAGMKVLVVAIGIAVGLSSGLRQSIVRYALKYDREARVEDFTMESTMRSRQFLIDRQMENFKARPMIGHGFQVSEMMVGMRNATWKELITAPIEKGVWVTAVLEEGGVVGFVILILFLLTAGFKMLKRGAYTGLSVFFAMVISNMAEFTMFSMSAMGGFFWAMVFIGAAMDAARLKNDQMFMGRYPHEVLIK